MDGTGNPWYYGDLAICGDKIAAIGSNLEDPQARVLDVTGMVVAPGFVDLHTHTELTYLVKPDEDCKISQGVTLELGGHCALILGLSFRLQTTLYWVCRGWHMSGAAWRSF